MTPKTLPINEIQEIFDMKQLKKIAAAVLIAAMLGLLLPQLGVNAEALKRGSRGDLVRQLQTRLRSWGYYSGTVDGVYGAKTESAVRAFQKRNGLTADGIVGQKTAAALGLNLPSSTGGGSAASSNGNLYLLARLVHGEARGEPYKGKVAVAAVVLNRVRSASFPNTIAGVIYQSGAFDAVSDGQINLAPDDESIRAARDAMNGWGSEQRMFVLLQSCDRNKQMDALTARSAAHRGSCFLLKNCGTLNKKGSKGDVEL